MRDLKYHFGGQHGDILICTWREPEHTNGPINLYLVQLMLKGKMIHTYETEYKRIEWNTVIQPGNVYKLSVKAKSNKWGEAASITFPYFKAGELH